MIDLSAFFAETAAAAQQPRDEGFPGFPVSRGGQREEQAVEDKDISRISRISRSPDQNLVGDMDEVPSAGAHVCAGVRARDPYPERREMREQREIPAGSDTSISRSISSKREIREILEPLPADDGLAHWHAGLARLDRVRPPCPGYRADEWLRTFSRAMTFLDAFGAQAEALGWTAPRLFGVHPVAGIVRVDHCGGLVLPIGGAVRAITAHEIAFGHLTHRRKGGQPEGVPLWELHGRSGR